MLTEPVPDRLLRLLKNARPAADLPAVKRPPDQPCSGPPPVSRLEPDAAPQRLPRPGQAGAQGAGAARRAPSPPRCSRALRPPRPRAPPGGSGGRRRKAMIDVAHRLPFLLPAGDRRFRHGVGSTGTDCARRAASPRPRAWRRMVKSQARRFVPSWNWSRAPMARTSVSCTRSSAASPCFTSTRAKRRSRGISAAISGREGVRPGRPVLLHSKPVAPYRAAISSEPTLSDGRGGCATGGTPLRVSPGAALHASVRRSWIGDDCTGRAPMTQRGVQAWRDTLRIMQARRPGRAAHVSRAAPVRALRSS